MDTIQTNHPARRSSRIDFRCRVKISGVDPQGNTFSEETGTICISKFGASLKTAHPFTMGQTLSVQTLDHGHTGQFQVVWMGQPGTPEAGQIGIEWVDARRFWGIEFPPEDWGGS
jgi:hypothetical protein